MAIQSKTYAVGTKASVRRLDNLTGSWIDVSVSNTFPETCNVTLLDVETVPTNANIVFVVGVVTRSCIDANIELGIYVSYDAGVTWTKPSGNYTSLSLIASVNIWQEVTVVDINNIFICGSDGIVLKSIDGGATFNVTTQILTPNSLKGEDLTSIHFITPTIGVVGSINDNVYKTINGGLTWTHLNGALPISGTPSNSITGIHISSDQQTIVALGIFYIYVSVDAGLTFTQKWVWVKSGIHLTWTDDLNLWATGAEDNRLRSMDGGLTWSIVTNLNPGSPAIFAEHFYLVNQGFFASSVNVYQTFDGSFTGVLSDISPSNITYAIWTNYKEICFALEATDCDPDSPVQTLYVTNDLSDYIGQVIKICPEDIPALPGGTGTGLPIFPDPLDQGNQEFTLTNCCDPLDVITIQNNFGSYQQQVVSIPALGNKCWYVEKELQEGGSYIGFINVSGGTLYSDCTNCNTDFPCVNFPVLDQCRCFVISQSLECEEAFTLLNISTLFPDCEECLGIAVDCYTLTDCSNPNNFFVTNDPIILNYVDQIVTLQGCPDICYIVTLGGVCSGVNLLPSPILESFATCVECNPAPLPTPVQLRSRMVKPGYDTPGCSTQYTEKISCNFAEQVFDEMAINRYGVTICCDHDIAKWEIKKDLLDLKSILDPNFIIPGPVICTCYSIQAIVNTVTFRYINCEGCATTITVAENTTEYVCSQSVIEPICAPSNSQFLIVNSETSCTTNDDCAPNCFCYAIEPAKEGVFFSYYNCNNSYIEQTTFVSINICAIENTVTIIEGIGTITNVGDCSAPECTN